MLDIFVVVVVAVVGCYVGCFLAVFGGVCCLKVSDVPKCLPHSGPVGRAFETLAGSFSVCLVCR